MEVNPISSGGIEQAASLRTLTENFDTFLSLLTTQLKNQDPLAPMDSTEFTSQLVQFSNLEQQITQTGKLEQLLTLQTTAQNLAAVGYLGKTVQARSPHASLTGGTASIPYELPVGTTTAVLSIVDSSGATVRTIELVPTPGSAEITWDGKDGNGIPQPDGTYSAQLLSIDGAGQPIDGGAVLYTAIADEVFLENGALTLNVGGVTVPLSDIVSVKSNS